MRSPCSYSEVRAYFSDVEHSLELLAEPIDHMPSPDQIELLDYALERIVNTQESVDDSGGFRYNSINLIHRMYLDAFEAVDWSDDKKAEHLIKLLINDDYNLYGEIPNDYINIVSSQCVELFYQKVQSRWDQLPPLDTDDWDERREYDALLRVLEGKAKTCNDTATLIWLNRKVANSGCDFLQLAKWSIELERFEEAQAFIKKAGKQHHSNNSADIHEAQQSLLLKTGRVHDALEAQWQQFQTLSSYSSYQSLLQTSEQAQSKKDWKRIAVDWLKQQLSDKNTFSTRHLSEILMSIYLADKDVGEAWQLSQQYEFDIPHLKQLAILLTHDVKRASALYVLMADRYVNQTCNESYQQAISLLQDMAALSQSSEHQINMVKVLEQMREKFRLKRNFIKWLNEAFPRDSIVH